MIRHIVFFSVTDRSTIERVAQSLGRLAEIPDCAFLEVGHNLKGDQWSNDVDLVVYGEFENEQALADYKAHPLYQETTSQVRPLRELRMAADFQSSKL